MLRALLARLFGGSAAAPPEEDPIEYNGYRIRQKCVIKQEKPYGYLRRSLRVPYFQP